MGCSRVLFPSLLPSCSSSSTYSSACGSLSCRRWLDWRPAPTPSALPSSLPARRRPLRPFRLRPSPVERQRAAPSLRYAVKRFLPTRIVCVLPSCARTGDFQTFRTSRRCNFQVLTASCSCNTGYKASGASCVKVTTTTSKKSTTTSRKAATSTKRCVRRGYLHPLEVAAPHLQLTFFWVAAPPRPRLHPARRLRRRPSLPRRRELATLSCPRPRRRC